MNINGKQRDALSDIIDTIDKWRTEGTMEHWQYSQLFDIADAALAEPLRNCEVGNAEEQYNRFTYCCTSRKIPCRRSYTYGCAECYAKWSQRPYESDVK